MRYNKPRRNRFRGSGKSFARNDYQNLRTGDISNAFNNNIPRKSFSRNGQNPEKLIERYNDLAKEALSNGDKILSESYYQYADHFLRVIENRNLLRNNSKSHSDNSLNDENSGDKVALESEKSSFPQQPKNGEEV